ncbi:MmcQ/YjbR family DNA-binding protein [Granulicella sibirica]|uniref:MmcQ/YjbR family DNA-binding protein n=1 Tax=Granulicella sibirica TaxID=2479048 RepID=A0A4Q0T850_9BACT|nr:MmcQ/YjbR family DNA-binding protein [Granulicella sibirica]RXH58900.1 protein of unknown function DUF419 [Granulicella sibirica]
MDAERARAFLLKMPHVVETLQWGNNLVFWVGDKAIGGKMFVLIDLDRGDKAIVSYAAGPERYGELLELDGLIPAPYMARIFWVAAGHWGAHKDSDWERELTAAYELTMRKLPPKVVRVLALPAAERKRVVAAARKAAKAKR